MQSVTMKRKGLQFLSLDVPGLAERRPSLVYGDFIFARIASADASETTPYQVHLYLCFVLYHKLLLDNLRSLYCIIW